MTNANTWEIKGDSFHYCPPMMMNPASLSTLPGTAMTVAATTMTTMTTTKEDGNGGKEQELKVSNFKDLPTNDCKDEDGDGSNCNSSNGKDKGSGNEDCNNDKGEEDGDCDDNKDIFLGK